MAIILSGPQGVKTGEQAFFGLNRRPLAGDSAIADQLPRVPQLPRNPQVA